MNYSSTDTLLIDRNPQTRNHVLRGRIYNIPEIWEAAKELTIFDVPLLALDTSWTYSFDLRQFASHYQAVCNADLSYPIILDDRGLLIDGGHRIVKSMILNLPTIKVVRFIYTPPHEVCDD